MTLYKINDGKNLMEKPIDFKKWERLLRGAFPATDHKEILEIIRLAKLGSMFAKPSVRRRSKQDDITIQALRKRGYTIRAIAMDVGVSYASVQRSLYAWDEKTNGN